MILRRLDAVGETSVAEPEAAGDGRELLARLCKKSSLSEVHSLQKVCEPGV